MNTQELPDTQPNTDSMCDGFSQLLDSQAINVAYGRLFVRQTASKSLGMTQIHVQSEVSKASECFDLIQPLFQVGRDARSCDYIIDSKNMTAKLLDRISKVHFHISRQDESHPVIITDMSVNGTFINGEVIGKFNKRILLDGDVIALALAKNNRKYCRIA